MDMSAKKGKSGLPGLTINCTLMKTGNSSNRQIFFKQANICHSFNTTCVPSYFKVEISL